MRLRLALLLTGLTFLVSSTLSAVPPNIILIFCDDLGYGDKDQTGKLQRPAGMVKEAIPLVLGE